MTARWIGVAVALTLVLGATVALSWGLFGGSAAFRGPISVLRGSWPLIYGAQALMAAAIGAVLVQRLPRLPVRTLMAIVGAAWLGEGLGLLVGGTALANELVPGVAGFYWLIGTGGPLQPAATLGGALIASRPRMRVSSRG
jgi:hypothetical protein